MEIRTLTHWLNWTIVNDPLKAQATTNVRQHLRDTVWDEMAYLGLKLLNSSALERTGGQKPYPIGYRVPKTGLKLFFHPKLEHALFSASGSACEKLHQAGLLDLVIEGMAERVTRIDLALDIKADITPKKFLAHGVTGRIRSTASFNSEDGLTEYLGSRASDRMVRVYRYHPPHIRHEWLRIEFEFGGKLAKAIAKAHRRASTAQILQWQVDKMQFAFLDAVTLSDNPYPVTNWEPERAAHKTERWLRVQAAPAFRRLVDEGVISDPDEWIRLNLLASTPD